MSKKFVLALLITSANVATVYASDIVADCERDLDVLPRFLSANDAGGRDHIAARGENYLQKAFEQAKQGLDAVASEEQCEQLLDAYLKHWRHDHLGVNSTSVVGVQAANPAPKVAPSFEELSKQTVLITIPSFNNRFREPLAQLLSENEKVLGRADNWIIDVRKNSGGSDSTYASLLPWLLPDEFMEVGAEFLATEANFVATRDICKRYEPDDAECRAALKPILTRMRVANHGDYVAMSDSPISFVKLEDVKKRRPDKVAVLIDKYCGSSCEQFVLAARQSYSVKIIGRNTAGALDYSNLRPYELPSGKRQLMYATSRSARLPIMPVDASGIMPDIYLPELSGDQDYAEEIRRVQDWLEGGSLAPR